MKTHIQLRTMLMVIIMPFVLFSQNSNNGHMTGTVTDIDGNVYKTVKIGEQWWMMENLKVTHYRSGDPIPNVTNIPEWISLTTGAYCNYDYDEGNVETYGRLYNWYAVNDRRNIAPAGWHVASWDEWIELINYLGGVNVAGGKMKVPGTYYWRSPNEGATNESGFSGLPGGFCSIKGFEDLGRHAYFWTNTELNANYAESFLLLYHLEGVGRGGNLKHLGLSIRCVLGELSQPPIAMAKDIEVGVGDNCLADVAPADVDNGSYDPDGDAIKLSIDPAGPFGLGTHIVILTVSDGQETATATATVTVVDITDPVLTVPADMTVSNAPGECGVTVGFDVTARDNCDPDVTIVCTPPSGSFFPVGTTTVECTATDDCGNEAADSFDITVEDTEPPVIDVISDALTLWPVNHKYKTFTVPQFVTGVSDNCSDIDVDDVVVTRVSSDEEEDAKGGSDGNTKNDMVIADDGKSVKLRAERQGNGNGRVYTVYLSVSDECGKTAEASCQVGAPHDKKDSAVADSPVYWVENGLGKRTPDRTDAAVIPEGYALHQNYPNPFNPSTQIGYDIPDACKVSLKVFNMAGQQIRELVSAQQQPGRYTVAWDATDDSGSRVPSGMYIYQLRAGTVTIRNKMTLMK